MATVALLSASGARADGFYVSGSLDGVFPESRQIPVNETKDPFGNQAFNNGVAVPYQVRETTHPQAGGEVDAAAGYRLGLGRFGGLRVEGEFSFRYARNGDYTLQSLPGQVYGTDFRADYRTISGLYGERYGETGNIFYDLPRFSFVTPTSAPAAATRRAWARPASGWRPTRTPHTAPAKSLASRRPPAAR